MWNLKFHSRDFFVTVLNLCCHFLLLDGSPMWRWIFCYSSIFSVFDLIKKDRFSVRGWVGKVKELIDFFSTAGYVGMLFSSATPAFSVFTQ